MLTKILIPLILICTLLTVTFEQVQAKDCSVLCPTTNLPKDCKSSPKHSEEINQLLLKKEFPEKELQQRLLLEVLAPTTNLGCTNFLGKKLYRGSFLTFHPKCIKALVDKSNKLTVVNIYSGSVNLASDLSELERREFKLFGVADYLYFQDFHTTSSDHEIVTLIEILNRLPGDIYLHCFGGIHKTGLLFGVIQKCINKLPIDTVIEEYRCHASYQSPHAVGSSRKYDEDRLKNFDCSILQSIL
jgi:hypothetical protein